MQLLNGHVMETTYYQDFTIAEISGTKGVNDTYEHCFAERKDDKVFFAELAIVLNLKIWEHYNNGNIIMQNLYHSLYKAAEKYIFDNWNQENINYYLRISD